MRFAVLLCLIAVLAAGTSGVAQTTTTTQPQSQRKSAPARKKQAKRLSPQQQFVLDVVKWAVALPAGDQQDRLRILTAATEVIAPVNGRLARQYAREGAGIEAGIIASGQTPDVSILSAGHFDCSGAADFIAQVPVTDVAKAEQSLINVLSACPKQGTDPVRQKLETAMGQGELAPRALMAVMEQVGATSPWSQDTFSKMFRALPVDAQKQAPEAPNYAAMYAEMAPKMDKDAARSAGLVFLDWLKKLDQGGERNLAVNITVDTLKKCLGDEGYNRALEGDVIAREVANTAGSPGEVARPEEENVSILAAMKNNGTDQSTELEKMPSSLRAREAAAHGFASGTAGDKSSASRYFDIAFSAVDEVWNDSSQGKNAPAVVQEVSEAAAHVDSVDALKRAQHLSDPAAQAIGMLSVARVVLSSMSGEDMSPRPVQTSAGTN